MTFQEEMPSLGVITARSISTHQEEEEEEEEEVGGMTTPTTVDQLTPSTLENINGREWSQLNPEHSEVHEKKRIVGMNMNMKMKTPRSLPTGTTTNTIPIDSSSNSSSSPRQEPQEDKDLCAMDLISWQSVQDLPERRLMVQRIMVMTEKKRVASFRSRTNNRRTEAESTSVLAKRMELSLYSRAGSMEEYKNLNTLRRRLQSLVTLSFHEASAMRSPTSSTKVVAGKRPFPCRNLQLQNTWHVWNNKKSNKKQRVVPMPKTSTSSSSSGNFLFGNDMNQDTLGLIFSFLKGTEVLRLRILNQFASSFLSTCVRSLEIEMTQCKRAFTTNDPIKFMKSINNLEQLVIYRKKNPHSLAMTNQSLHAWGCMELDVAQENSGEIIVNQLALAMEEGACKRLRKLQLVSLFTNTTKRNAIASLCMALSHGSCPQIEDLLLGGNSLSDLGSAHIALMLKSGSIPNLVRLDLRRNYIGEIGLNRIMNALAFGKVTNLKFLCMGGNIIADNCVEPLKKMLASFTCPQMRFLGLEDNFLTPQGVQSIIQAAVVGGMVPKLHRVQSTSSPVPVRHASSVLTRGISITQSERQ
jgi:hypothetical protein